MMGGHTKSSSHEHSMFGHLCKTYRYFVSKKHSHSGKHKTLPDPREKSIDGTYTELNDKNEARRSTSSIIHRLRSHKANEVHPHDDTANSPKLNTSRVSKKSALFRSISQTQTQTQTQNKLMRSLTRQNADSREPTNVGPLKKSNSSTYLDTMSTHSGPLFRSASRKGAPDIVYSNSNRLAKLLTVEQNLACTLEDLCFGCVKKITIDRNAIASNGKIIKETETLSIKVKPGWTKGTKVTFEGTENEEKGTHTCDVRFVITEKKHKLYTRDGDDLELAIKISLLQALTGCTLGIPLLSGEEMNLELDDIITPGFEKIIVGQGMPKNKEPKQRGNLKITFLVDFPMELTVDQRREIGSILCDSF